jgi:hypothetical protein
MPRYDQWRRLVGDTADHPALLDLGKKLLGYLDEQRRLSGVKTMSIQRTLPDGSIVRARFDGDLPCIEVRAAKPTTSGEVVLQQGIVAHPRSFADAAAFGAFPDTLLIPNGGKGVRDTRDWQSVFYDADWTPDPETLDGFGIYRTTQRGQPLFEAGLTVGGNVDWRNDTERLVVTWDGPGSRYFNIGRVYGGPFIYHNGVILLDVQEIPELVDDPTLDLSGVGVNGACLRQHDGGWWLYAMVNHRFGDLDSILRLYRVPLVADEEGVPWFKRVSNLPPDVAPPEFLTADLTKVERLDEQRWTLAPSQCPQGSQVVVAKDRRNDDG